MSIELGRRNLLQAIAGLAYAVCAPARSAQAQAISTNPRLSIAETPAFRQDPEEVIQQRFDMYRSCGVGTLRTSVGWAQMEPMQDRWVKPRNLGYIHQAMQSGFDLKLLVSSMGAVPSWFLEANPDLRLLDQNGESTGLSLSYWHPRLEAVLASVGDDLFSRLAEEDILSATSFLIIDAGAAGEGKYPSPWNLGRGAGGPLFWCYDPYAQQHFSATMQSKYGSVVQANAAWGTSFGSWSDLKPPQPGASPGALWSDVLGWYRDSKRNFIAKQIDLYNGLLQKYAPAGHAIAPVLLIPGEHVTPDEWQAAVSQGSGNERIAAMIDTEFLLESAARTGCQVQYTGEQNEPEVRWLTNYMRSHNMDNTLLWGENAGHAPNAVFDPTRLAGIFLKYGLYGLEYVNSSDLFESDRVTPNEWFASFRSAYVSLRDRLAAR